jgi:hypothetical protein
MTPLTLDAFGALLSRDSTSLRLLQVAWLAVALAPFPAYAPEDCAAVDAPPVHEQHEPPLDDALLAGLRVSAHGVEAHPRPATTPRRTCRAPRRG